MVALDSALNFSGKESEVSEMTSRAWYRCHDVVELATAKVPVVEWLR